MRLLGSVDTDNFCRASVCPLVREGYVLVAGGDPGLPLEVRGGEDQSPALAFNGRLYQRITTAHYTNTAGDWCRSLTERTAPELNAINRHACWLVTPATRKPPLPAPHS